VAPFVKTLKYLTRLRQWTSKTWSVSSNARNDIMLAYVLSKGEGWKGLLQGEAARLDFQRKDEDLKDVECFKFNNLGHYANKFPESKAEDTKGVFEKRKIGYLWSVEGKLPRISVRVRCPSAEIQKNAILL